MKTTIRQLQAALPLILQSLAAKGGDIAMRGRTDAAINFNPLLENGKPSTEFFAVIENGKLWLDSGWCDLPDGERPNTLTCVYCGHQYPEGTPPHGSQILTDHIKACERHPMRELELANKVLRSALVATCMTDGREDLENLRQLLSLIPDSENKSAAIQVCQALLDTLPKE